MRTIALCSVGALLLGASTVSCYDEPAQPEVRSGTTVVTQSPPQQSGSVTVVHRDDGRGVMSTQPAAPPAAAQARPNAPVINNFVTSEAPGAPPTATTPQDVAPAQPIDDRARATQVVAEATQQIDKLTRVLSMSARDSRHADIEAAVAQLQAKRERVLKDIESLEIAGASSADDTQHVILNRDVSDLQEALRASYKYDPSSTL
jgi:hypothetical protein